MAAGLAVVAGTLLLHAANNSCPPPTAEDRTCYAAIPLAPLVIASYVAAGGAAIYAGKTLHEASESCAQDARAAWPLLTDEGLAPWKIGALSPVPFATAQETCLQMGMRLPHSDEANQAAVRLRLALAGAPSFAIWTGEVEPGPGETRVFTVDLASWQREVHDAGDLARALCAPRTARP